MDAESYKATLSETLFQSAQNIRLGRRFPFEQDNTLKHTAKKTQWLWGKHSGYGETTLPKFRRPEPNRASLENGPAGYYARLHSKQASGGYSS